MKKFISILFIVLGLQLSAQNTFHLIVSIDRYSDIAESCTEDFKNMKKQFADIAKAIDMKFKVHDIEFNTEKTIQFIETFNCEPTDIVFYYYSGHGYRFHDQKVVWPYLDICDMDEEECGVSLDWVHRELIMKKPKMSFAFGDCCNSIVEMDEPKSFLTRSRGIKGSTKGYKALFNLNNVHIVSSGSLPGQYSLGTDYGGIYTNSLLNVLKKSQHIENLSWKYVLDKTKSTTINDSDKEHTPHYMILLGGDAYYSEGKYPDNTADDIVEEWIGPDEWEHNAGDYEDQYLEYEKMENELYDMALLILLGMYMDDDFFSEQEEEKMISFFTEIFDLWGYDSESGIIFIQYLQEAFETSSDNEFDIWFEDGITLIKEELTVEEEQDFYNTMKQMVDNPNSYEFKEYIKTLKEL